jgi:tRNA uridine 5-carboxymethylaminomethyl modification enzyme
MHLKYAGYIERQLREIAKFDHLESIRIPKNFDYAQIVSLSAEARQRFFKFTPENLGAASRIYGISPADLSILLIALQKK